MVCGVFSHILYMFETLITKLSKHSTLRNVLSEMVDFNSDHVDGRMAGEVVRL